MPLFNYGYDRNGNAATGHLTIDTSMLKMEIDRGAVIYLKDNVTGEEHIDTTYATNFPAYEASFINWCLEGNAGSIACSNSNVSGNQVDNTYTLTYTEVGGYLGNNLVMTFEVDSETGEVLVSQEGTDGGSHPYQINMPFMNFGSGYDGRSVIGSDGWQHFADDTDGAGYGNEFSAFLAVGQGQLGVIGLWSETTRVGKNNECVKFWHYDGYDHLVTLAVQVDTIANVDPNKIYSGPWRVTCQTNWVEVARRWGVRYEAVHGAQKLWENDCTWWRNIHCMWFDYSSNPSEATLNAVAAVDYVTSTNLVCFNWNMDREPFSSDNQMDTDFVPDLTTYNLIKGHGWKFMDGFAWTQIESNVGTPTGWEIRWSDYEAYHPANYVFTPDYPAFTMNESGTYYERSQANQADFVSWLADSVAWSGEATGLYVLIHPASDKGRAYMLQRWGSRSLPYASGGRGSDGSYCDILGSAPPHGFAANFDGMGYEEGCVDLVKRMRTAYPDKIVMSETSDNNMALGAQCPITWQGFYTLITPNHPLRAALVASYYWHRDYEQSMQVKYNVMIGALPRILIGSDGWAVWSRAQASLYCKFELHHNLPTTWVDSGSYTTLAYFRSGNTSRFRFEDRGSEVYAFVEEHWQGDYDRLVVDDGVITTNNIDEDLPSSYYTRGSYISLPSDDTDLTTPYNVDDIADVAADDTDMVPQLATSQIAIHQFKQQIIGTGGVISVVVQVTIPCSTSTAYLQIYNRSGTPAWDTIDSDNATGANTDFTLSASVADLTDYKDESNIVACRVYQEMQ